MDKKKNWLAASVCVWSYHSCIVSLQGLMMTRDYKVFTAPAQPRLLVVAANRANQLIVYLCVAECHSSSAGADLIPLHHSVSPIYCRTAAWWQFNWLSVDSNLCGLFPLPQHWEQKPHFWAWTVVLYSLKNTPLCRICHVQYVFAIMEVYGTRSNCISHPKRTYRDFSFEGNVIKNHVNLLGSSEWYFEIFAINYTHTLLLQSQASLVSSHSFSSINNILPEALASLRAFFSAMDVFS